MCLKPARLATALAVVLAIGAVASPAFALFGKTKPKPAADAKAEAKIDAKTPAAPAAAPALRKATAEERIAADRMDPLARAAFWAHETQIDPTEIEAGLKLSQALRALGKNIEASQAADIVLVGAPTNVEALLESARSKIAAGQAFYSIELLQRAQGLAPKDWRPASLLGVAYEQTEQPDKAKQAFDQALALSPENPAVLSNLALFHAARGDAALAETLLRRAVARPEAEARERQNLALVLGLQGKIAEAERLMRQDLPPEIANANLAYLRANPGQSPLAQTGGAGRSWNALEGAQQARPAEQR